MNVKNLLLHLNKLRSTLENTLLRLQLSCILLFLLLKMNKLWLRAYLIVPWKLFGSRFCIVYFVQIIDYMQVFENCEKYVLAGIKDRHILFTHDNSDLETKLVGIASCQSLAGLQMIICILRSFGCSVLSPMFQDRLVGY
jgi:hypothetical protein